MFRVQHNWRVAYQPSKAPAAAAPEPLAAACPPQQQDEEEQEVVEGPVAHGCIHADMATATTCSGSGGGCDACSPSEAACPEQLPTTAPASSVAATPTAAPCAGFRSFAVTFDEEEEIVMAVEEG